MNGLLNARDFGAVGSETILKGCTHAGSCELCVEDIGDFAVGQYVTVNGGRPRCDSFRLFGPHNQHAHNRPVNGEVEYRGWDASNGPHAVYMLDIDPECPDRFRWSDDMGRHWTEAKMSLDWQMLSCGLEVRFHPFDWSQGWVVTMVMRSSYRARVVSLEPGKIVLDTPAEADAEVTVLHDASPAIQAAIDAALSQNRGVWLPNGHYRISDCLYIRNPLSFTLRGESAEGTILDIGVGGIGVEAQGGSCIVTENGFETKIYDLSFRGGMGFDRRDQAGHMQTRGATGVWGFYFMKSNAMGIWSTERVYVENCHARRMSAECFYSSSACRVLLDGGVMTDSIKEKAGTVGAEPLHYTKSITYMRCSVEDCARNAFNNNDFADNTQLIGCRICNVGGCTWEGASRFVKMSGCYVCNAGSVAMGNVRNRREEMERLGTGQHVISDNVFERGVPYGTNMISASACATQVIIRGNTFVNFNGTGIYISGDTGPRDLPARNAIITGNSFDMTAEQDPSIPRKAIRVTAEGVTVADNQIYINGTEPDENLTAIEIADNAVGAVIHDNTMHLCGKNIVEVRAPGRVGEPVDDTHFYRWQDSSWEGMPPVPRRRSDRYHDWRIVWEDGSESFIENVDPETGLFTLKAPHEMRKGDRFDLHPSEALSRARLVHDNLVY